MKVYGTAVIPEIDRRAIPMEPTRQFKALKPKPAKCVHPMKGYRGLYAVVHADGRKAFAYRYTSPETSKRRQCVLNAVTADAALTEYEEYRGMVRDGDDPLTVLKARQDKAERKRAKKAAADRLTVKFACEFYLQKLRSEGKDRTAGVVELGFKADVYPEIGSMARRLRFSHDVH